ncbi:putative metal-dependent RNase [Planctomycetales bacterium 10988]|nr:putative metal-dependent RNase [Planctomycetales bacterium 10988]
MHEVLNRNLFFVKERAHLIKTSNQYDVLDPETGEQILQCSEETLGFATKFLRCTDFKRNTPFDVQIRLPTGEPILRVTRGVTFFTSHVTVLDENNQKIGGFKQKIFSIGGSFTLSDAADQPICSLKGSWTGWNFRFVTPDGIEFASVTKKWAGVGKELFTSADNYVLKIEANVPPDNVARQLIFAAVMCIDLVLKE